MAARIKSVSVKGLRTLDDFTFEPAKLNVLIGENGCGKSSVVEVFELIRRLTNQKFIQEYNSIHGGDAQLLRKGQNEIELDIVFELNGNKAGYGISFNSTAIKKEIYQYGFPDHEPPELTIHRKNGSLSFFEKGKLAQKLETNQSSNPFFSVLSLTTRRVDVQTVTNLLNNVEVQLPFDTAPHWATRSKQNRIANARESTIFAPADQVEVFGANLPNVFFQLKESGNWDRVMDYVQLGLGYWVEDLKPTPEPSGGKIALWIKAKGLDKPLPISALSEGQIGYLGIVAMTQLNRDRTLFCMDEVETHLHPGLIGRAVEMFEGLAEHCPVILTTHSRRVLDALSDPAASVRALELNQETMATEMKQFDSDALDEWLKDYEGLGQVLDAGYGASMLVQEENEEFKK